MQMVTFVCKGCGAELEVPDAHASEAAECPLCGATLVVPMPGIVRDRMLGGFRIERRLGAGAMGEVWLATQVALGRKVALKILAPSYTRDVAFLKRFRNEVLTVAKLTHPNIVPAYDAGVDCGIHYLAMAFIDGTDLDRQLKVRKVVPEQEALAIVRKLAGALRYAWDKFKLIHRDIKPSNIMMDKAGVPLLMDLGLSKSVDQDHSLTVTGAVMGTPYYISPEQAKDEDALDFRCDLYSLGVTLYHMVTGRVPFDGTTMAGIMTKHIVEPFPPPRERNPAVTEECSVLLATMMAKNPGERQKSWQALITDIDLVLAGNMPETCWPDPGPSAVVPGMGEVPPRPHPVFKGARKAKVRQVDGTSAAVDAARFEAERAQLELQQAKQAAQAEIVKLVNQVDVSFRRLKILRKQVDLAANRLSIAQERMDDGRLSEIGHLEAQAALSEARSKYLDELRSYLMNRASLDGKFAGAD